MGKKAMAMVFISRAWMDGKVKGIEKKYSKDFHRHPLHVALLFQLLFLSLSNYDNANVLSSGLYSKFLVFWESNDIFLNFDIKIFWGKKMRKVRVKLKGC